MDQYPISCQILADRRRQAELRRAAKAARRANRDRAGAGSRGVSGWLACATWARDPGGGGP